MPKQALMFLHGEIEHTLSCFANPAVNHIFAVSANSNSLPSYILLLCTFGCAIILGIEPKPTAKQCPLDLHIWE
jgi:hypothetical protein